MLWKQSIDRRERGLISSIRGGRESAAATGMGTSSVIVCCGIVSGLGGSEVLPILEIGEDGVQNCHDGNARTRASALATAIGTDKFGALACARNDDGLNNFPDEVWFDGVDDSEVIVTILSDGLDERKPVDNCILASDKGEPASKISEARGLNDPGFANG